MIGENEKIHLPDIPFSKFCEYEYRINRGIYNTIDGWFYEQGETDILSRRRRIIDFLDYLNETRFGEKSLGKGGLSKKLHDFYKKEFVS